VKYIVLAFVVIAIIMFSLVLKTPGHAIRSIFWRDSAENSKPATEPTKVAAKPVAVHSRSASRAAVAAADNDAAPQPADDHSDVPVAVERNVPRPARNPVVSVTADSAALYAMNSSRGGPIDLLKQGTVVEPSLRLLDGHESWTLISVPTLKISGFVHSENLATNP
jgi:hypothetical protein